MRVLRKSLCWALLMGLICILHTFPLRPASAEGESSQQPSDFQFIYIDANVGGSSGGHSALRLGDTVYHFQYFPEGLFKLVRERWTHFRYIYNDLENRTLYVAHIRMEKDDFQRLREYLNRYYLIQEAHMARLDKLTADANLLKDLSRGHFQMSLNGAGLFSPQEPPDNISTGLRSAVIDARGEDYLTGSIKILDQELLKIPLVVPEIKGIRIHKKVYPAPVASLSRKYAENRLKRTALDMLDRAAPVSSQELTDMDRFVRMGDEKGLTRNERQKLSAYAEILKTAVIHLPASSRPDWGYALLLANARYQAVMRSLKENKLYLLDPFPESAKSVPAATVKGDPDVTAKLADRAWRTYRDIRRKTFTQDALAERSYNRLEEGAGRFAELERGRLTGRGVRVAYGRLIPSRTGKVPLNAPNLSRESLNGSLGAARQNREAYSRQLKECYPYDLIERNCATELVRAFNTPFKTREGVTSALGGEIVPGRNFNFIPFCLFGLVKDRLRVTRVDVLPGYRKRMVLLRTQENPQDTEIYFRECNTLTSTLYHGTKGDTPFLFFTDDVVWVRPLYGAINGAYGLITAALGVFTLPLDGGDLSLAGLKGTLYSLPELFFFNIRKGSFNYVDDPVDSQTDTLERSAPAFDRYVYP